MQGESERGRGIRGEGATLKRRGAEASISSATLAPPLLPRSMKSPFLLGVKDLEEGVSPPPCHPRSCRGFPQPGSQRPCACRQSSHPQLFQNFHQSPQAHPPCGTACSGTTAPLRTQSCGVQCIWSGCKALPWHTLVELQPQASL